MTSPYYFVDGPTATKIAATARHLRKRAGRLSGHAAGSGTGSAVVAEPGTGSGPATPSATPKTRSNTRKPRKGSGGSASPPGPETPENRGFGDTCQNPATPLPAPQGTPR